MPAPKSVKLKLEKNRTLRFERRSLFKLQQEQPKSIPELLVELQRGNTNPLVWLVWAGLLHEEPELDVLDVADIVDLANAGEIGEAVGQALEPVLNAPRDEEAPKANRAARRSKTT